MDLKVFGKRLRNIRLSKHMSIVALSDRTSISESMLRYYEIGRNAPTIVNIIEIAKALNVSLNDLLDEEATYEQKESYIEYVCKRNGISNFFMNLEKLDNKELLKLEEDIELSLRVIKEKYKL